MNNTAFIIILMAVLTIVPAGCAPVQEQQAYYASCPTGTLCLYDIKTGDHWWQRLFTPAHRLVAYRDDKGILHPPIDEQASSGDALEEMSGPLSGLASHVTIPVIP